MKLCENGQKWPFPGSSLVFLIGGKFELIKNWENNFSSEDRGSMFPKMSVYSYKTARCQLREPESPP